MIDAVSGIITWVRDDWRSHPFRFVAELVAWSISLGCSIIMAVTVPDPPFMVLYPMWITGCSIYSWAAYSRGSFGMLANYFLLTAIDIIGFIRILGNA